MSSVVVVIGDVVAVVVVVVVVVVVLVVSSKLEHPGCPDMHSGQSSLVWLSHSGNRRQSRLSGL